MNRSQILSQIKEKGFRITRARRAIISILLSTTAPVDANKISKKLKQKNKSVNITTVYRELHFLEKQKILSSCGMDSQKKEYIIAQNPGTHAHCTNCNKFIDVCSAFENELEKFQQNLEKNSHFKLSAQQSHLHGLCQSCQ